MKYSTIKFEPEKDKLLLLLILTDLGFIVLHILHTYTPFFADLSFSIERDRGYAEIFQYIKESWIAALLFILATRKRSLLYFGFSLLFAYFLVDDSFQLHESLGRVVADFIPFAPGKIGLRRKDFGELIVSGCFGALFFTLIAIGYYRSDRATKRVSRVIVTMILLLAFFGVPIDILHTILWIKEAGPILEMGMIEDGGEMLVMSVITWFVFRLDPTDEEISFLKTPAA
jgi:hypothetical protein